MAASPERAAVLGLRANAGQFTLLVGVSALVGAMVGQERAIVPLLATDVFGLSTATAALSFLVAFGVTKAITNLVAGALADRVGRKPVLVSGWLVGLPVPFMIILAPEWGWIVAANILLGINQGLTWSTTVLMKVDLVGPSRRGLALGLNEAAGYLALAVTAYATGLIAQSFGLRPAPFFLGIAIAGLGLGVSALVVQETHGHALHEAGVRGLGDEAAGVGDGAATSWLRMAWRSTIREPSLSAASQAGLINNLNDGLAWGLFPVLWAAAGLDLGQVGLLAAAYPATWGVVQVATGGLSDRIGRKPLIVTGMFVQAAAIAAMGLWSGIGPWLVAAIALGLGTAMVYPTLLAVVTDVADPRRRGSVTGVYRFWRDLGFAVGAVLVGVITDRFDPRAAILLVAALTALSGLIVAVRMRETPSRLPAIR